jgi:alpha-mannosidase
MIPPKVFEKFDQRVARLDGWRYRTVGTVDLEMAQTSEHFYAPPDHLDYAPVSVGLRWGDNGTTNWFRGTAVIPEECAGKAVYYRLGTVAEMLVFIDGVPVTGMCPTRPEARISREAQGGASIPFYVEAYAGHLYPGGHPFPGAMRLHQCCHQWADKTFPHTMSCSELLLKRETVDALYYDLTVLMDTAKTLDECSLRRAQIIDHVNKALDLVPWHWKDEQALEAGCQAARDLLAPLLAKQNGPTTPFIGIVGHAHMDIAWLWPLRETIRKSARTFSNILNLLEDYPEMTFMQSEPILCQMIEDHYPALLPKVKAAVARGAWQPNGGMWVESDCNIPSGESFVRQFLEGRKKTMELFGYAGDTLWLPDVFGYMPSLPQIMKGCGIEYFVTAKLNGNDTNAFPHGTYDWEGIDGTRVFAHRLVCQQRGYNAHVTPTTHKDCWDHVTRKELQDRTLSSVGYGDGGGGVTREMCEYARRMHDLEGSMKTDWVNASDFLRDLRDSTPERPRWVGEMYFEEHRGTYTTQARSKRYNRKLEFLLREVEMLYATEQGARLEYPSAALQRCWRTLLTNQFHDILAGSSIRTVHELAEAEYAAMEQELTGLKDEALRVMGADLDTSAEGTAYVLFNSLPWTRTEVVEITGASGQAFTPSGTPLPTQAETGEDTRLAVLVEMPPLSLTPLCVRGAVEKKASPFTYRGDSLDTPHYSVQFDAAGKITGLYDKAAQREVVQQGRRLNDFYTAQDIPTSLDAWNIDRFYRDVMQIEDRLDMREVVADGPLRLILKSRYAIGEHSALTQEMVFHADSRRIDFRTEVQWQETHRMLKTGFALDIHAETYRNEIQFGHIQRPLHDNTSFEQARFEVCAHKWVDLSEGDYGVALLNDCKYGHDVLDDMLSLTLLKSPWAPDELADKGYHEFSYALLPHAGGFSVEQVVREAYQLNVPATVAKVEAGTGKAVSSSFCTVSNPNVVLETIKKAEESDAIVLRLYEAGNTRGQVTLDFGRPIRKAALCNMLELDDVPLETQGNTLTCFMRPFQVTTLKVWM